MRSATMSMTSDAGVAALAATSKNSTPGTGSTKTRGSAGCNSSSRPHALVLLSVFVLYFDIFVVIPSLLSYIYAMGGSNVFQAATLASFSLAGFASQAGLGRVAAKLGYRPTLAIAFAAVIIGNLAYALAPMWGYSSPHSRCPCGSSCEGKWLILLGRALAGLGSGGLSPLYAYVAQTTPDRFKTAAFVWLRGVCIAALAIGPAVASMLSLVVFPNIPGGVFRGDSLDHFQGSCPLSGGGAAAGTDEGGSMGSNDTFVIALREGCPRNNTSFDQLTQQAFYEDLGVACSPLVTFLNARTVPALLTAFFAFGVLVPVCLFLPHPPPWGSLESGEDEDDENKGSGCDEKLLSDSPEPTAEEGGHGPPPPLPAWDKRTHQEGYGATAQSDQVTERGETTLQEEEEGSGSGGCNSKFYCSGPMALPLISTFTLTLCNGCLEAMYTYETLVLFAFGTVENSIIIVILAVVNLVTVVGALYLPQCMEDRRIVMLGIVIYLVCACANIGACACNVGDVEWSGKNDISIWNILAFAVFSLGSSVGNTIFQGANTAIYVKLLPPQNQAEQAGWGTACESLGRVFGPFLVMLFEQFLDQFDRVFTIISSFMGLLILIIFVFWIFYWKKMVTIGE